MPQSRAGIKFVFDLDGHDASHLRSRRAKTPLEVHGVMKDANDLNALIVESIKNHAPSAVKAAESGPAVFEHLP